MKKIILPTLLMLGLFTNAQVLTGTKLVLTNSQANGQTFANNTAKFIASLTLSAGTLTNATSQSRALSFYDMPQSNLDTSPSILFNLNNRNDMTRLRFSAIENGASQFYLFDKAQAINFEVKDDGTGNVTVNLPKPNSFVNIGTNSFNDGAEIYRLSVNGAMRAHRVKVYTTWADYVFEEGYKLPTLEEVEKHIKEKGHLQDIPSAKEVEANGIELGEMNKLLLQKIEELTLYMIDQKKETEKQGELIKQLEEQVKVLSNKE